MFGKKELQRELEQKEQQIQELNRRIKEYQDKNDAVVSALTDAKSAANRIIGAAEAKRDDIIAAAMREKADMDPKGTEYLTKPGAGRGYRCRCREEGKGCRGAGQVLPGLYQEHRRYGAPPSRKLRWLP